MDPEVAAEASKLEDVEMATADTADKAAPPAPINVGREIVQDLIKAFQVYLDERKWRNARYIVRSFPSAPPSELT